MSIEIVGMWVIILWSISIFLRLGRIVIRLDRIIELLAKIHDKEAP